MTGAVLKNLRRRLIGWSLLRLVLASLTIVGLGAWLALLGDAAFDFSSGVRRATPWIIGGLVAFACSIGWWRLALLNDRRAARLLERRNPAFGTRLTNAVEFGGGPSQDAIQEYLRQEAIELGRRTAGQAEVWPVVRGTISWIGIGLAGVVMVWGALAWLGGGVLDSVVPRFLDPSGDHPPFSRLRIEVTPGASEVLYGGQLEIHAAASGRPVDKLWLVARSGTNTTRAIMFLAPDKSFFQTLANLREPAEYYVTDGQARTRHFPVKIINTPQITLVEFTTTFPEYTGKPERTARLSDDPDPLPLGTQVRFRVASNRPLRGGTLSLTPLLGGKPVDIELGHDEEGIGQLVTGGFIFSNAVVFSLNIEDTGGLACAEPRRGRFRVLPDERPRIQVLEPGRNAVATPDFRVPIRVRAEDDYGVSKVLWLRGHNRSVERPYEMKVEMQAGPSKVESAGAFDLSKLGVRAGDVLEYYFEAADNDPRGPNLALSRVYRLEVISPEQYQAVLRRMAARRALFEPYFKLGAWLERLAERARQASANAGSNDAAVAEEARELLEQLEKYYAELKKLMESAPMFDVEETFRETLKQQQQEMAEAMEQLRKQLKDDVQDAESMRNVSELLSRLARTQREEVTEPAAQIAAVVALTARAESFVRLAQEQAMVAQLLRRFADKPELSRLEQLEVQELIHQQRRVRQSLRDLIDQLPDLAAQLPDAPEFDPMRADVSEFLRAVIEAGIEQDMVDAVQALGEPDTMTGQALAQRAAEKMEALIGECQGMAEQGADCLARFQPKLPGGLSGMIGQILAAMQSGQGQGEGDGYSMFNDDVGLYGPGMELAGDQGAGEERDGGGSGQGSGGTLLRGEGEDPALPSTGTAGRIRLQPDAKFPLRYRELVGEYFKAMAEFEENQRGKR